MNETELARHFEESCYHNEHPTWDLGPVGKFALSELPRDLGFKVILSGEGADELFIGYPWWLTEFLRETDASSPDLPLQQNDKMRQALLEQATEDIKLVLNKIGAEETFASLDFDLQARFNNVETPFMSVSRITPQDIFLDSIQRRPGFGPDAKARALIDSWPVDAQREIRGNWHTVHTAMYAWSRAQLPNYILSALGDRSEMAHSIEGRPPFLDQRLAEMMGRVPPSLKMRYDPSTQGPDAGGSAWQPDGDRANSHFWEKWILREAMKPFITEELYLRRKHPYTAPLAFPKDGPMHNLFKKMLTEENIKALGFIQWPVIQDALERGVGKEADPLATRKCITVASFIALQKQFGIERMYLR
jgi:asparagine synthase (glutamine-hydrolysing)